MIVNTNVPMTINVFMFIELLEKLKLCDPNSDDAVLDFLQQMQIRASRMREYLNEI